MDQQLQSDIAGASAAMDASIPRYRWVREQILKRIAENKLRRGDSIDSEVQIAKQFGVSLGTVRKAVDDLVAQQILVRRQGKGTFVATRDTSTSTQFLFHLVGKDDKKELPSFHDVLGSRVRGGTLYESRRLHLSPGERVTELRRSRRFSDGSVMFERLVLPNALFPDFEKRLGDRRPVMLYDFYEQEFGITVMNFEERLRSVGANRSAAGVIACALGAPLLEIERTGYSYNDVPVELRITLCETRSHYYFRARL